MDAFLRPEAKATARMLQCWVTSRDEPPAVFRVCQGTAPPLRDYLSRFLRSIRADEATAVVAWVYLDRFVNSTQFPMGEESQHMLCLASFMLAHKWTEDNCCLAKDYAYCGGVSLEHLHLLELHLCQGLDWRMSVSSKEFESYRASLRQLIN